MTQNLIKDVLWYDPKSQRVVIIHNITAYSVYYRNLGEDTVYATPTEGFLSTFTCQSHSPD